MSEERRSPRALAYSLPSLAVVGGLGALEVLRSRFQQSQVFLPDRYPNGIWDPSPFGLPAEDVWFHAEDGVELHGWWIPHPRAGGTILFCHGNTGSIAHRIGLFRYLRRLKVNLLAFDYRGYGRSEGEPSEKGLYRDVRAAYRHLMGPLGQEPERLLLFGHSLGGAVAIDAAQDCPAAGLIVQSSFTDVRAMARSFFPQLPIHLLARNQFRSAEKVGGLALPKLFIHGTADGTVPLNLGRELFARAAEPKELMEVPNAGHNDLHRHGGVAYFRRLNRFRKACFAAATTTAAEAVATPSA